MKSGFVAIVGRSNVGKSTLLNTLVGTKIAATSFRAQMTRHLIHGVMNIPGNANYPCGQAVFVDTPGFFRDKKSSLTSKLLKKVHEALEGIDLIIYVVDPSREIGDEERGLYGMVRHLDIPKLLVLNKSDLPQKDREHEKEYRQWTSDFEEVFTLSALRASHIQPLREKVLELLPEGEAMYLDNQLTNVTEDFFVEELIREKAFAVLDKEVPYSLTVKVDSIENKPDMFVIEARILTDEERYKKIIIGKGAYKIKEIGQLARKELEQALNKKVFLALEVEVDTHWVEGI
ncbi:MAG: GTPase Era [Candidatus Magasanikbacteria bacterium CG11_big_fil_rev_8_21_14_0_20_43_7]|uniref:GTPase Era n=1 Tax=Candidatus Magasanikbacteria bacterium CG11_big_fil_rev_8_21_14_0_20_43_7 TaxID=1974654 RepID=A0A2H0N4Q2_9BACT|nr:MAG: GTPase Era [Candidatus Magasanikbacteria bacterium CG11_big_fil_rev_8_21_14_0_20_43_7]